MFWLRNGFNNVNTVCNLLLSFVVGSDGLRNANAKWLCRWVSNGLLCKFYHTNYLISKSAHNIVVIYISIHVFLGQTLNLVSLDKLIIYLNVIQNEPLFVDIIQNYGEWITNLDLFWTIYWTPQISTQLILKSDMELYGIITSF